LGFLTPVVVRPDSSGRTNSDSIIDLLEQIRFTLLQRIRILDAVDHRHRDNRGQQLGEIRRVQVLRTNVDPADVDDVPAPLEYGVNSEPGSRRWSLALDLTTTHGFISTRLTDAPSRTIFVGVG
jgi:hypothetical protein